jgi:hypothetical protein
LLPLMFRFCIYSLFVSIAMAGRNIIVVGEYY